MYPRPPVDIPPIKMFLNFHNRLNIFAVARRSRLFVPHEFRKNEVLRGNEGDSLSMYPLKYSPPELALTESIPRSNPEINLDTAFSVNEVELALLFDRLPRRITIHISGSTQIAQRQNKFLHIVSPKSNHNVNVGGEARPPPHEHRHPAGNEVPRPKPTEDSGDVGEESPWIDLFHREVPLQAAKALPPPRASDLPTSF